MAIEMKTDSLLTVTGSYDNMGTDIKYQADLNQYPIIP